MFLDLFSYEWKKYQVHWYQLLTVLTPYLSPCFGVLWPMITRSICHNFLTSAYVSTSTPIPLFRCVGRICTVIVHLFFNLGLGCRLTDFFRLRGHTPTRILM